MASLRDWTDLAHRPGLRFAFLVGPGAAFILIALLMPLLSIVIFSFWRTESYELYADWNLNNYRALLGEAAYRTFFLRSLLTAVVVSFVCLVLAWPVAYFIAKHGGRYRLLLILLLAAPFFTGGSSTGVISTANRPAVQAAAAFICDRHANASWSARDTLN